MLECQTGGAIGRICRDHRYCLDVSGSAQQIPVLELTFIKLYKIQVPMAERRR
jgi:hypothetical protein